MAVKDDDALAILATPVPARRAATRPARVPHEAVAPAGDAGAPAPRSPAVAPPTIARRTRTGAGAPGDTAPPAADSDMPTRSARKMPSPARIERENANDEIYERIRHAILEHRLPPGTKLVEERLAEIFGVSRARVREVLARLAHEQIVELFPQRGAYVARPTAEQARDVFEARRLIEPALLGRLVASLTPEKVERLRQHQALELDARRRDDKQAIVRLSGEFHTLLADLAGNTALARSMRELSTLTCLIIFLYDAPTATSCRADEHSQILEAIARRDLARAEKTMLGHLDHIESSLKLDIGTAEVDLEAVFRR